MLIQYGQEINTCNSSFDETNHSEICHGHCKRKVLSDLDVDLHNESELWSQNGMIPQGVPNTNPPYPVPGIAVDLLRLEVQLQVIAQELPITEEAFEEKVKTIYLNRLKEVRLIHQAQQAASAESDLVIPKKTLFVVGNDTDIIH